MSRMPRTPLYSLVLFCAVSAGVSLGQTKKTVNTAADLPRFSYPLTQPASSLLTADDATFNAFAKKVEADVNSVLADYNISDKRNFAGTAGRQAERAIWSCGVPLQADGEMGPKTLAAENSCHSRQLLATMVQLQTEHFAQIAAADPSQKVYLKGCDNGADALLALA